MFVSSLSEVDVFLSKVNVLLTEVNKKLGECSVGSRKVILPRIYNIIEELEWTMSLSEEATDPDCGEKEEDCTYSGAFSPPASLSSDSFDVESLSWDHSDFYKLYFEDEEDDEDEDHGEKMFEKDDHGPIQFSASSVGESSKEESLDLGEDKIEDATTVRAEDDCARFVTTINAKIDALAPNGFYEVVRPIQYTIDLTKVNEYFLRNIPKPTYYPVHGVSDDPKFYTENVVLDTVDYYGNKLRLPPKHRQQLPFGGIYGYKTDVGIVPVPNQAIFGHVWKAGEGWVLQAQQADDCRLAGGSWSPPPRTRGGRPSG